MKYFYSTLEAGRVNSRTFIRLSFGVLAFLFQTIKENQNGLRGLNFAANTIHSELCAFPHDMEKLTQVFENILKTMWTSSVISNSKEMRPEAKARWALITPSYQQGLQHNSKTQPIPTIAKKINSTPAKNCPALYAASHIRGLAEHNKAPG